MARPRSPASLIAASLAASKSCPASTSSAPKARMAAFFSTELPWGTTMVAAMPLRAAASAMLWP